VQWVVGGEESGKDGDKVENAQHDHHRRICDPPEALRQLGSAYRHLAQYEFQRGQDPGDSFDRAIRAYDEARSIDPARVSNHDEGLLFKWQGQRLLDRGSDPREALGRAVTAFEAGLRRTPEDIALLNNLGNTFSTLASMPMIVYTTPSGRLANSRMT